MKLAFLLILLSIPSMALEGDFKEVKEPERPVESKRRDVLPQTEYQVRNIGKSDPRFASLYKELAGSNPGLTLDSLYSRLLAGETFKVERAQKPVTCKGCNGFGRVPDKSSSSRSKDGKVVCPECNGAGKKSATQTILVKW